VDQKAQGGAGGEGGKDARRGATQVERDDRHRGGDDRADARRQTVDAVGEVHDVHHRHQPDHGERRPGIRRSGIGQGKFAHEWQRDLLDSHAEVHDDHGSRHLARQLRSRGQVEAVVKRTHQRDQPGGKQHAVPQLMLLPITGRQPDQSRNERAREDRCTP